MYAIRIILINFNKIQLEQAAITGSINIIAVLLRCLFNALLVCKNVFELSSFGAFLSKYLYAFNCHLLINHIINLIKNQISWRHKSYTSGNLVQMHFESTVVATQFLQVHLFSQTEPSCYLHIKIILTVHDKLITECLIGTGLNSIPWFTSKRLSFGLALHLYSPTFFFCVFICYLSVECTIFQSFSISFTFSL